MKCQRLQILKKRWLDILQSTFCVFYYMSLGVYSFLIHNYQQKQEEKLLPRKVKTRMINYTKCWLFRTHFCAGRTQPLQVWDSVSNINRLLWGFCCLSLSIFNSSIFLSLAEINQSRLNGGKKNAVAVVWERSSWNLTIEENALFWKALSPLPDDLCDPSSPVANSIHF